MAKNFQMILLLIGFIQLSYCEIITYKLDVPGEQINNTEKIPKSESPSLDQDNLVDDRNLSKRRSYYEDKDDRNPDFDFWQKSRYNFDANSNFGNPMRKPMYQNINQNRESKYSNQEEFNWGKERNRLPYEGSIDGSMNMENKHLSDSYISNSRVDEKLEYEKPADFFNPSRNYMIKDNRDSRYSPSRPNSKEMNNFFTDTNGSRRLSIGHQPFLRDYEKPKEFIPESEMAMSSHPSFHIPPSIHCSLNNDFAADENELCKPEKAIIINLKTECPLSKNSRKKVVHKYLFSPKGNLNSSPSQFLPNNQYYSSDPSTTFYYI